MPPYQASNRRYQLAWSFRGEYFADLKNPGWQRRFESASFHAAQKALRKKEKCRESVHIVIIWVLLCRINMASSGIIAWFRLLQHEY